MERRANVQGFIALAPPIGGTVASVSARVSGELSMSWLGRTFGGAVADSVYQASIGAPSVVMLLPYASAFGDATVVTTPSRTYTVSQLQQLLSDIGDPEAAAAYSTAHSLEGLLATPIADVDVFCIYGKAVKTPVSLRYKEDLVPNQRSGSAASAVNGKGDGVVNLESMQLCKRAISGPLTGKVTELGQGIDHMTILTSPPALRAIGRALRKLV